LFALLIAIDPDVIEECTKATVEKIVLGTDFAFTCEKLAAFQ